MKKVLAAALFCAVSSFATWDYFPIKGAGKGEVKAGVEYFMQDKWSAFGINAGARYSVIEGLEAAIFTQFPMSLSYDGNSCEEDEFKCPPTFAQPAIGVRYWLPMGVGIALDLYLPFQGKAMEAPWLAGGKAAFGFHPAVQYSTNLTSELSLGSEVGVDIWLADSDKFARGMDLGIGLELDYSLGSATPYVGVDVGLGLTKPTYDGKDIEGAKASETSIDVGLGLIYAISEALGADAGVVLGFGKAYEIEIDEGKKESKMPITIKANVSYNF